MLLTRDDLVEVKEIAKLAIKLYISKESQGEKKYYIETILMLLSLYYKRSSKTHLICTNEKVSLSPIIYVLVKMFVDQSALRLKAEEESGSQEAYADYVQQDGALNEFEETLTEIE